MGLENRFSCCFRSGTSWVGYVGLLLRGEGEGIACPLSWIDPLGCGIFELCIVIVSSRYCRMLLQSSLSDFDWFPINCANVPLLDLHEKTKTRKLHPFTSSFLSRNFGFPVVILSSVSGLDGPQSHDIAPSIDQNNLFVCLVVGWSTSGARISARAIGVIIGNFVSCFVTYFRKLVNFRDFLLILDLFNGLYNEAHLNNARHWHSVVRERHTMATYLWNPLYSTCSQGMRYATEVSGEGQIIIEWSFSDTFGNFEVQPRGNRKHLVRLTAWGTSLTWVIQQFWNISWPHPNGDLIQSACPLRIPRLRFPKKL